jgi:hypothetical protein
MNDRQTKNFMLLMAELMAPSLRLTDASTNQEDLKRNASLAHAMLKNAKLICVAICWGSPDDIDPFFMTYDKLMEGYKMDIIKIKLDTKIEAREKGGSFEKCMLCERTKSLDHYVTILDTEDIVTARAFFIYWLCRNCVKG